MCSTCHDHDYVERMARPKHKYVNRIEVMAPAAQSYAILFTVFIVVFVVKIMN